MKENTVSKVIRGFGLFFIIAGILAAMIVGIAAESWTLLLVVLFCCVLSGIVLIGFAEIIRLLQLNVYKTEKLIKTLSSGNDDTPS